MSNTPTKQCSRCNKNKDLTDFYFRKDRQQYHSMCNECITHRRKEHYENNKERISKQRKLDPNRKETARKYYKKNKEKNKARRRVYTKNNKEKIALSQKRWQEKNQERIKAVRKEYWKTDSFKISSANRQSKRRFTMKQGSLPININYPLNSELQSMLDNQNNKCAICDTNITREKKNIQLDHKKPLAKGGEHTIENIQWLCADCNRRKSDVWSGAEAP